MTMECSARHAPQLPAALVVPSLCQMTTIGILPLTQTQLSAALTPLHAGLFQLPRHCISTVDHSHFCCVHDVICNKLHSAAV